MKFNTDTLNTLLIIVSLILAYMLPFELFLISYAILGPLHYITEINWIQNKKYFVKEKYWLQLCVVFALIVAVPALVDLKIVESYLSENLLKITNSIRSYSNMAIFLCLVIAYSLLFIKKVYFRFIVVAIMAILSFILVNESTFNLVVGILLPTLIHVYLFTLLFMWYGTLKKSSKVGSFNVVLLMLIPFVIYLLPYQDSWRKLSEYVTNTYVESNFYLLNVYVSKLIGASDGTNFNFSDIITRKIQLFISFAYTYHYLNWFSKTTVIGWHKNINASKLILLLVIWISSVALYAYNFKLGLILLLFLSFMHVFLEFPINIISIREISKHYITKLNNVKEN
ncbi:hypothetical protein BTO06_09030 [Tenacibaculum sp. SZ-18]|uniref:hypothetical protein n=1 Tax=Tenacibaculum sp. SZ-18 TaxID=754423 RepID=UPI000C2CEEC6|nr:hypothetical protein [Tenacibaculum sp. SZ-18]AUC15272.1 hypothetical protein BTO06_09030 [Tenacibaculum sp. SZ-18]